MKKIFKIFLIIIIISLFKVSFSFANDAKIKIGLLVPLTGENKNLGQSIIKSTRMALNDIGTSKIEIYPKDTGLNPNKTLQAAKELKSLGVRIFIGPVFFKSLIYLNEIDDVIFLSLTNKITDIPENVVSGGVNSLSQINTIKKFLELNEIKKTIFLTPNLNYKNEIETAIKQSKIKISKKYTYDIEPTKLTKQIEEITNYKVRKQNLEDEIYRIKNSNEANKEKKIKKLEQRYTLGGLNFDAVIIADFDESLKSVTTSLLYTDVSPKQKYFITFNQWFDKGLLNEIDIQPLYYPSINKNNFDDYKQKFFKEFNEYPSHLSLLSYDLVGLVYYLSLKNNFSDNSKLFKVKNTFKGKIGIFDIKNNKINHRLNFYKIEDKNLIKIF